MRFLRWWVGLNISGAVVFLFLVNGRGALGPARNDHDSSKATSWVLFWLWSAYLFLLSLIRKSRKMHLQGHEGSHNVARQI